ncbi:hypothetical protein [Paenibacillus thermotolerans]|uniref:hypothetical protein n=1 Tax=Paenibacillus thermotolerans TaxID=3027807 RepID=UPI0023681933|nr:MULTISPECIES: hypothetical protein [unclassified Paenibacillus]
MNKKMVSLLLLMLMSVMLLSACGSKPSWEEEELAVVSDRVMSDNVDVKWTLSESESGSGEGTRIRLEITNKGEPIRDFDITHEKLLHLIVVSKDLSYFNHIHPEYKGDGVFEIVNDFPAGGEYRVIADFRPSNGDSMSKLEWVKVEKGESAPPLPVVPDESLVKAVDGNKVSLATGGLTAKEDTVLTFSIADEQTGEPVTDLEPYLGAVGHVVILSEDGERYVHVHAEEGQGSGPDAVFETQFPRAGIYKVWGQFQRNGEVFTVSYVVNVQ